MRSTSHLTGVMGTAAAALSLAVSLGSCTVVVQPPSQPLPDDTTSSSPAPASPSEMPTPPPQSPAPPSTPSDGGCDFAMVDEGSSNAAMQELASQLFDALTCGGEVPIEEQLLSLGASDDFAARASEVGASVEVESARSTLGGVEVSAAVYLMDTTSSTAAPMCSVMATANPVGKAMTCLDVGSGEPPTSPDFPTPPVEQVPQWPDDSPEV